MARGCLSDLLAGPRPILGEGAVIERLRRQDEISLDPLLVNAGLIYDPAGRRAEAAIISEYLAIARQYRLPLLLSTPTWRASHERIRAAGYDSRDVNGDNVRFLQELRATAGADGKAVICGLLSCRGDAYRPQEALDVAAAREFHLWQAGQLAVAGVDVLLGATLPALSEALGMAMALATTGSEFLLSFVVRPAGTLLDNTPLTDAVAAIDASAPPLAYLINCTHSSFVRSALLDEVNSSAAVRRRIVGILANTAALSPEELDGQSRLVEEDPDCFAAGVDALSLDLGLKIAGGCCGTDGRHITALAARLAMRSG